MNTLQSRIVEEDAIASWHNSAAVDGEVMDGQPGRLESDIEYIKRDVAELKTDVKALRIELKTDVEALRVELKTEIKELRVECKADNASLRTEIKADIAEVRKTQERDFRLLFSVIIAVALGTATLLAKIMGWIK